MLNSNVKGTFQSCVIELNEVIYLKDLANVSWLLWNTVMDFIVLLIVAVAVLFSN